jgi:hypothetical protein
MIFLVPAILGAFGLWKDRNGLVVLAVALFLWISWNRKQSERKRARLFSVPMPPIVVPEFGSVGGDAATSGPGGCGCA